MYPDTYTTQVAILFSLIAIYTLSAVSGVTKGIQLLSRFNVILAVALMLFILLMGPTAFIFDSYIHSFGLYINNFIPMATFRADTAWLDWWTVSFGAGF